MNFVGILSWFMGSIAGKVLLSLGMGFLTFGAVLAAGTALAASFAGLWGGLPSAILKILSLAGFPVALGWVLGAWIASLTLNTMSKLGKIPT